MTDELDQSLADVLLSVRDGFDEVLATLEAAAGWQTNRVQRPVLILGALDGAASLRPGTTGTASPREGAIGRWC